MTRRAGRSQYAKDRPTGRFTDLYLRNLQPAEKPYRLSEQSTAGSGGRLVVAVMPTGSLRFYYRFRRTEADGSSVDTLESLGLWHRNKGDGGITLEDARRRVDALRRDATLHAAPPKERRTRELQVRAERALRGTVGDLLGAYVESLQRAGRTSAREVERALQLNVRDAFPAVWKKYAADVTPSDIRDVLAALHARKPTRRLTDKDTGKPLATVKRQTNKVRAYLRAAWQWGARAEHDIENNSEERKRFGITANPVDLIGRKAAWDKPGNRTLSDQELGLYCRALDTVEPTMKSALSFVLHTCCQRVVQAIGAPWSSYDFERRTVLLIDRKGSRAAAREHLVPLTDDALSALAPLRTRALEIPTLGGTSAAGPFFVGGKQVPRPDDMSKAVGKISKTLAKTDGVPPFTMRDLRRSAETMLQAMRIPKEVRAHLLSHGRGAGVQSRHYERHDYYKEKVAALKKWQAHLRKITKEQGGASES